MPRDSGVAVASGLSKVPLIVQRSIKAAEEASVVASRDSRTTEVGSAWGSGAIARLARFRLIE